MEEISKKETEQKEESRQNIPPKESPLPEKKEKNTGMAIIAYIIFFIPLLTDAKDDPFVKYHVKQGFVLFLAWLASSVVSWIPFIGWILSPLLWIFCLILFIIGIINALNGSKVPLPVIGKFGDKFNF